MGREGPSAAWSAWSAGPINRKVRLTPRAGHPQGHLAPPGHLVIALLGDPNHSWSVAEHAQKNDDEAPEGAAAELKVFEPEPDPIPRRYQAETRSRITLSPRAQDIMAAMLHRMVREGWVDLLHVPDQSELVELALEHAARTVGTTRWDLVAAESRAARKKPSLAPAKRSRSRKTKP